jgi:hypothetical protein
VHEETSRWAAGGGPAAGRRDVTLSKHMKESDLLPSSNAHTSLQVNTVSKLPVDFAIVFCRV